MQEVNRIACVNAAGFVQEFRVIWDGGRTDLSPRYPNLQSRTIDLRRYNIPDGTEVWVEVHAMLGRTKQAKHRVKFVRDHDAVATYRTKGTTLFFEIGLEG